MKNKTRWISLTEQMPPNKGKESKYFSTEIMVKCGRRKYVAVFQTEKKEFYRVRKIFGGERDKLFPTQWKPLTRKQRCTFERHINRSTQLLADILINE